MMNSTGKTETAPIEVEVVVLHRRTTVTATEMGQNNPNQSHCWEDCCNRLRKYWDLTVTTLIGDEVVAAAAAATVPIVDTNRIGMAKEENHEGGRCRSRSQLPAQSFLRQSQASSPIDSSHKAEQINTRRRWRN
jgi:hypothetical protein